MLIKKDLLISKNNVFDKVSEASLRIVFGMLLIRYMQLK